MIILEMQHGTRCAESIQHIVTELGCGSHQEQIWQPIPCTLQCMDRSLVVSKEQGDIHENGRNWKTIRQYLSFGGVSELEDQVKGGMF